MGNNNNTFYFYLLGHIIRCLSNHPYFCPFVVGPQPMDSSNERFAIEQQRIEERIKTVRAAKKSYI